MELTGKKVLVTGAAGFIGSHLTQQLVLSGACVRAFVRYNSWNSCGFLDQLPADQRAEIEVVTGDLRDPDAVRKAVRGAEIVFHLGALISIPYSYQHPTEVVQTNVLGTLHVLQAVRQWEVERMIHTSTSEVYGTAQYVPIDEGHPLQGQSPYSASKIAADKLVESFHRSYQTPVVTVRPFNAYGPRQSMRAVIPTIINQALHGSEIVLGNLSVTRDFTYVEDTAQAFIRAAVADEAVGDVFNVGSGREMAIHDLVQLICRIVGKTLPVRVDQARLRPEKSEVRRLLADSTKAARVLQWRPTVPLEEGLRRTVEWIRQHPHLYRRDRTIT
ncbi:MAG: NAD-dependent dehydratase [Bacillaceae bacterium G1]|nr:NAD-dependent dehydratase [Bacillota bacterium]OJF16299.1 MAG: NAD-dependent dehydratase [Bacillaceae bacterium G1]